MKIGIGNSMTLRGIGGGISAVSTFLQYISDGLFYFNIQNLDTLFQDSAGTIPAVVGDPVGLVVDSWGLNNAVQITTGLKPILRQDTAGKYYLEMDGIDDKLVVTFSVAPGLSTLIYAGPDEITTLPVTVGTAFEVHTGSLYSMVLVNREVTEAELGSTL